MSGTRSDDGRGTHGPPGVAGEQVTVQLPLAATDWQVPIGIR